MRNALVAALAAAAFTWPALAQDATTDAENPLRPLEGETNEVVDPENPAAPTGDAPTGPVTADGDTTEVLDPDNPTAPEGEAPVRPVTADGDTNEVIDETPGN